MVYDVHIISVGSKSETAFTVIKSGLKIDKIYLLNNSNSEYLAVEEEIREGFKSFPIDEIKHIEIDPFDYDNVFKTVIDLYNSESENHPSGVMFHINFTMGTRVAVAAMCSAAYSINADLYYVKESLYSASGKDEFVPIKIDNINELADLKTHQKTLEIFRIMSDRKPKTNEELQVPVNSLSSLSYHTKYLSSAGLIKRLGSVRNASWVLTEKGEQVMKRL